MRHRRRCDHTRGSTPSAATTGPATDSSRPTPPAAVSARTPAIVLTISSTVRLASAEAFTPRRSTGSGAPFGRSSRSMTMLVLPGLAGAGHGATRRPDLLPPPDDGDTGRRPGGGSGPGKRSAVRLGDLPASTRAGARPASRARVPAPGRRGQSVIGTPVSRAIRRGSHGVCPGFGRLLPVRPRLHRQGISNRAQAVHERSSGADGIAVTGRASGRSRRSRELPPDRFGRPSRRQHRPAGSDRPPPPNARPLPRPTNRVR